MDSRRRCFLELLDLWSHEESLTHLFMVGDIFDLWIGGHDIFKKEYAALISALLRLQKTGVDVHYFEGNHDFHLSSFWQDELGIQVHTGPKTFQLGRYKVRVEHGDEMDPDDKGYLFLRWFLRTPLVKSLLCHGPGKVIQGLGSLASAQSQKHSHRKQPHGEAEIRQKFYTHTKKVSALEPLDFLISGHIHTRLDETIGKTRSLNLGTWTLQPCYFQLSSTKAEFINLL